MENSQKIKKQYEHSMDVAKAYYRVLSGLNDLKLTEGQLEFIAYLAVNRETFTKQGVMQERGPSENRINNIISILRKKGILLKDKTPTLHPALLKIDFSKPVSLNIMLSYETR